MTESIKELRRICQASRETGFYQFGWFERNFLRKVSIYFTKLFLAMKLSANQVTFISLLVGTAAGIFLTFGSARFAIIGALLLYFFQILDVADGEVARYNKTASAKGAFWDTITGLFLWQFILIGLSFGIYRELHEIIVLVFGFAALVLLFLYNVSALLPYPILHEKKLLPQTLKQKPEKTFDKGVLRFGRAIFGQGGIFQGILVSTLIDCFVSPFVIAGFSLNFRFLFLIAYVTAFLVGVMAQIYDVHHRGVKVRHF